MLAYLDTSALIAIAVPTDKNHRAATLFLRDSVRSGVRFVVGRPVLIEYIDGVTKKVGKPQAIRQLQDIEASAAIRVEPEADEDHRVARELFLQYDDQAIDLTDSLSFAIMERLGLKEVFTFDRDFAVHGFTRRP